MSNKVKLNIGDTLIGEYKILDIFGGEGKSGMGVVYLVTHPNHPEPFVIKTFQKSEYNSISRFRIEAETWVAIGIHPNIVQALFVSEINEQLFIGAEYIPKDEYGRNTITDYLQQGGTSNQNIIKWAVQFCYGMDQAISNGMKVHRDIKPDNLMIDINGNLKITDFGLSKFAYGYKELNTHVSKYGKEKNKFLSKFLDILDKTEPDENRSDLTSTNTFLGTMLYASPEQIMDSSSVDFRSDIYSFGIIMYQLISLGSYPYSLLGKNNIESLALMHLQEPIVKINHPLAQIAYKCLSRKPNERYQTFKELLEDLGIIAVKLNIKIPINKIQIDSNLRELYIQSFTYRTLGDLKKALQLIDEYLTKDKTDSSAWSLKGRIEYEMGNIDEGIKFTLISYDIDSNNSRTCNNLGLFYKSKKDLINAEKYLVEATECDPNNIGALTNLAILYEEKGDLLTAADLLIRAINLAPDKKTLHFNAGNIAAEINRKNYIDKAINILELLIKVDKDNINNWFNLALNYQLIQNYNGAIKCFKTVEQNLPDDEQTLISLVKLNGKQGNYAEAILYCEKLLDKKISILNALCWRAQYMQANGKGEEAIEFMKAVISNNESNDILWITLASLYATAGDYKKAVAMIIRARQKVILNGEQNNTEKMRGLDEMQNEYQRLFDKKSNSTQ